MIHAAVISACRPSFDISSISRPRGRCRFPSLDYLPGRIAFGLVDPLCIPRWDTSTVLQRKQQQDFVQHKTLLITFVTFFIFQRPLFCCCVRLRVSKMISSLLLHWAVHKILSLTPSTFPRWDTSTGLLQRKQQSLYNTKFGLLHLLPLYFGG